MSGIVLIIPLENEDDIVAKYLLPIKTLVDKKQLETLLRAAEKITIK